MKKINKRLLALSLLLLAITLTAIGTTVAYLFDSTEPIPNSFDYGAVSCKINEDFTNGDLIKQNVTVTNTSNIPAFIRAKIIITWTDANGYISAKAPTADDYSMVLGSGWVEHNGSYYYSGAVGIGETTEILIQSIQPLRIKDGYTLTVEVIAEAIQAEPTSAATEAWGYAPVN